MSGGALAARGRPRTASLPLALFALAYLSVVVLVAAPRGLISVLPAAAVANPHSTQ